jgi:hypothetical protein
MSEVIHGACLCGRMEYEVRGAEVMGACHCTRCQRWTGGAGTMVVVVPKGGLTITKGKDLMKIFHEEGFAPRGFCSNCGSGIYADGGEKIYVGAGGMKDLKMKTGFHIQVAYKAPWDEIGGSAPQFPEWPSS